MRNSWLNVTRNDWVFLINLSKYILRLVTDSKKSKLKEIFDLSEIKFKEIDELVEIF